MLPLHHDSRGKYKYGNTGWLSKMRIAVALLIVLVVILYSVMKQWEAEEKNVSYEKRLLDIQGQLQTFTADIDNQKQENSNLKTQIANLQETAKTKAAVQEQQAASAVSSAEALKIQVETAKQQANELDSDKTRLKDEVAVLERSKAILQNTVSSLEDQLAVAYVVGNETASAVAKNISKLETDISTLRATHDTTNEALKSANAKAVKLENELKESQSLLTKQNVEVKKTPTPVEEKPNIAAITKESDVKKVVDISTDVKNVVEGISTDVKEVKSSSQADATSGSSESAKASSESSEGSGHSNDNSNSNSNQIDKQHKAHEQDDKKHSERVSDREAHEDQSDIKEDSDKEKNTGHEL